MVSQARDDFFAGVAALRRAADLDQVITSNPPDPAHDEVSRLLRNGLTVGAFSMLEGFVARRSEEILNEISGGVVGFNDLPAGLQTASTQQVVFVMASEIRRRLAADDDPTVAIQEAATALASTTTANLTLSPLTLKWAGSNLSSEDLKVILQRLGVGSDPWNQLTMFSRRAGYNVTNLQQVFTEMMRQRHRAAHDASFDASVISVRSLANSASAIALGFDALASRGGRLCKTADAEFLGGSAHLAQNVQVRFVRPVGNKWKEYVETKLTKARKVYDTREEALAGAVASAQADRHDVVIEQRGSAVAEWITSDLP